MRCIKRTGTPVLPTNPMCYFLSPSLDERQLMYMNSSDVRWESATSARGRSLYVYPHDLVNRSNRHYRTWHGWQ